MKKSAFLSDLVFTFFSTFIVALCLLRYLRLTLAASLFFSAAFGILMCIPVYFFLDRKRTKAIKKQADADESQKLFLQLALSSDKHNAEYFRSLFTLPAFLEKDPLALAEPLSAVPTPSEDGKIGARPATANENEYKLRTLSGLCAVETPTAIVFPLFTMRPIDGDLVAEIIRIKTKKSKLLLCSELAPEARRLTESFSVTVKTGADVYFLLKEFDFLPERYEYEPISSPMTKLERKKRVWFGKCNARGFFVSGIMLLLTSLITPFPLYYLVFGGILLSSAIFIRIFGYR